jgi:predicted N-acetyltransferase YhbS
VTVPEYTIRAFRDVDLPYLNLLLQQEGMALLQADDLCQSFVAVNSAGEPVGFIRILKVDDAVNPAASSAYVYPVAVFSHWRGHGVGRALVQQALRKYGELRLVACRDSRDFYPKCGFESVGWEQIAGLITRDCELCPDLKTCDPQPYRAQTNQ